jgi:DNA-binding transcriptional ArsR family regulator
LTCNLLVTYICNQMVTQALPTRDIFHAIADPNRRAIIQLLARQQLSLNHVARHFSVSRPAISKHVKVLEECGLITIEQRGRERYCALRIEKLDEVAKWIEEYKKIWEERFDRLEAYLTELQSHQSEEQS